MTEEQTTTRRERRIADRRTQILQAAAAVFRAKGYDRATTKEIAEAADMSEGSLYNYFSTKRDLLLGLVQDFVDRTSADINSLQAEGIEELMVKVMASRFEHIRQKGLITLILHEARMDSEVRRYYVAEVLAPFRDQLEERLQLLINAGIMRPVNAAMAARTLMNAVMGFSVMFDIGDDALIEQMSSEELAQQVLNLFLNGLRPQVEDKKGDAA
jgi:AcrR family transcriptional regulator